MVTPLDTADAADYMSLMTTTVLTADQVAVAEQALAGAREKVATGALYVDGVQIKAIGRHNCMRVFPPGVRELVRRVLRGW